MPFKLKGKWRGQVIKDHRKHQKLFRTKEEALSWEAEERKRLKQEQTQTGMDFVEFCELYLDEVKLRNVVKTYNEKRAVIRRVTERFGNMELSAITSDHIGRYLNQQAQQRSRNAANKDRKNLYAMFMWGKKRGKIQVNPVAGIDKFPHDTAPQDTPTTEEVLRLLTAATPEEKVFLQAYLQTGARRSEIFRWTWNEDINFETREVRLGTRKTKDGSMSYEWLPMSDDLYTALWWWWQNRPIKDTPYVFVSTSKNPGRHYGKPYTERRWFMASLCKRAGIKHFGFHALRRYVASVLADTHKVSAKTIQRILRHKQVSTTERYIKNINRDLGAVVNLLGETKNLPEEPTGKILED